MIICTIMTVQDNHPAPIKILIVDDNPAMLQCLNRLLHFAGYQTATTLKAKEAAEITVSFRPALVILDLMMPELNGFWFLNWLRAQPGLAGIKALVLSAGGESLLRKALAAGADAAMEKPFDREPFLATVASLTAPPEPKRESG